MWSGLQTRFRRGSTPRRQPRNDCHEEDKEMKERTPKVRICLSVCTTPTSITGADAQKTQTHKAAKRQKQRIHPVRRVALSKDQLTTSAAIQPSYPTRRNGHEIPPVKNEQESGAEDLKCLPFA
ncbi:hypothetical protein mRhiFer1_009484 [Rhinolophus ferrumequinum]|uniref:Uncharacterized protein n=1 Tax=Rhinolophus ferrumequinum TaxID=59479 RepID=A0A7J7RET6_RHIFE|nr:hypothetical protein mRhiFer1_009484 [Rhinolophus ferrumequinum]